jgi:transcription antitermination factor NusG
MAEAYWAVAQTVTKMEHLVRRDIEKAHHGAFLPTCARRWKVDDREYAKERPLIGGYVFFMTMGDDYAGIPDITGVYRVLSGPTGDALRVPPADIARLMITHAARDKDETMPPRFTKYYNPLRAYRSLARKGRKPRASKRARSSTHEYV